MHVLYLLLSLMYSTSCTVRTSAALAHAENPPHHAPMQAHTLQHTHTQHMHKHALTQGGASRAAMSTYTLQHARTSRSHNTRTQTIRSHTGSTASRAAMSTGASGATSSPAQSECACVRCDGSRMLVCIAGVVYSADEKSLLL